MKQLYFEKLCKLQNTEEKDNICEFWSWKYDLKWRIGSFIIRNTELYMFRNEGSYPRERVGQNRPGVPKLFKFYVDIWYAGDPISFLLGLVLFKEGHIEWNYFFSVRRTASSQLSTAARGRSHGPSKIPRLGICPKPLSNRVENKPLTHSQ